mgnify:CR=1 FL=1
MFLDVDGYEALAGPLDESGRPLASLLLQAASARIREMSPGASPDSAVARLVAFEVVRGALASRSYAGHVSYTKSIGPWMKSGTLSNPDAALRFSDEHYRMLGVATSGNPHWHFGDE